MSVELISVLVAVLAIGATLAGLILTSNRGLRKDCSKDCARPSAGGSRPARDERRYEPPPIFSCPAYCRALV